MKVDKKFILRLLIFAAIIRTISNLTDKVTLRMTHKPTSPANSLKSSPEPKWAIKIDDQDLNYGQVHEMIHRDIVIGNDYRKERIKLLTALATGMFALTITFHKDLFGSTLTHTGLWLIIIAWGALIISLLAGIVHFRNWEDFYLAHRARGIALWDYYRAMASSNAEDKTEALASFNNARAKIKKLQNSYKWSNRFQIGALILGMTLLLSYVAVTGWAKLAPANQSSTEILKEDSQETAAVNQNERSLSSESVFNKENRDASRPIH